VVIFPPHSTHRLQPLDVGIFSPLSAAYSKELNLYTHNSRSFSRVTKGVFWQLFWAAWNGSIREKVIQSGFSKTGIYPLNPSLVLDKLRKPPKEEPLKEKKDLSVVKTAKEIRDLVKEVHKCPEKHLDYLLKCLEALSIDNECIHYENQSLKAVILSERKQRKPGKALGLVDGDGDKFAQFYSPTKYQSRVEALRQKETLIEEEKQQKIDTKALAKEQRDHTAQLKREAFAARKEGWRLIREKRDLEKETRRRERERRLATKKAQKSSKKTPRSIPAAQIEDAPLSAVEVVEKRVQTRIRAQGRFGREINKPSRFTS
jgi:DDE superfamily endonuclease